MIISQKVQTAVQILMNHITPLIPEFERIHQVGLLEMSKPQGERNLRLIMDPLLETMRSTTEVVKVMFKSMDLPDDLDEVNQIYDEIQMVLNVTNSVSDNFGDLEGLNQSLIDEIKLNLASKEQLTKDMYNTFGPGALERMITEDGLYEEYQKKMNFLY